MGSVIFIDAVESDHRIEDEQTGLKLLNGLSQALAVQRQIQAQDRRGDHFDGQGLKGELSEGANPFQAGTDHAQGIFGGEKQDRARAMDGEASQTGGARGNANGQIQSQEAFAAFRFAAENADGLIGPEILDEPLREAGRSGGNLASPLDG